MGVTKRQVVVYECNGCGHETEDQYDRGGDLHVTGYRSARSYNGDIGGANVEWWFCGSCVLSFDQWRASRRANHP